MSPDTSSSAWIPSIIACVASHLSDNERSCLRVVNKAASEALSEHVTIKLSQPVPVWAYKEHWLQPGACRSLTRAQRRQLVSLTASSNIVPNLEVALAASGLPPCGKDLEAAAAAGALDSCRWLAEPGRLLAGSVRWWEVMSAAVSTGHEAVCDWCLELNPHGAWGMPITDQHYYDWACEAAAGGHVLLMDKMLAARTAAAAKDVFAQPHESAGLFTAALRGCDLATSQRVYQLAGGPRAWEEDGVCWELYDFGNPMTAALGSDTPDWQAKLDWLLAQGFKPHGKDCVGAAALRSEAAALERFAWLKAQQGCSELGPCADECIRCFWQTSHAAIVELLIAEGATPPPDDDFFFYDFGVAAREGHLATLQLAARSTWGPWLDREDALEAATAAGRLEVLRWFFEAFRSDWDAACARAPGLLTWAARSGSVEAIRWVHSHGGGVVGQEAAWSGAVESGCQAAVEVLAELGGPMPSDGSPYARALELREWALLPLLHAQGVPMGGWAQERPLLARALEAGAAPASLLQGLAEEG